MTVGLLKELIRNVSDDAIVTISSDGKRVLLGAPADIATSSVDETVGATGDPRNWGAKNWKEGKSR